MNWFQNQVVDTPDLAMFGSDEEKRRQQVSRWKEMALPGPTAILLTVRSDVPFTQSDYNTYTELKSLWGDDTGFSRRLMVVFTFSDKNPNVSQETIEKSSPELGKVLSDASNVYTTVNNIAAFEEKRTDVRTILSIVEAVGKFCWFYRLLIQFDTLHLRRTLMYI